MCDFTLGSSWTVTNVKMTQLCVQSKITILRVPPLPMPSGFPPSVPTQLLGSGGTALQLSWNYHTATEVVTCNKATA